MNTMTPSKPVTDGQIGKFEELFRARLRKSGLQSDSVQLVLSGQGDAIADEMVAIIRLRVEAVSNLIVRPVTVNRSRSLQEALIATNRTQYVDRKVVDEVYRGDGSEVEVVFFKLDRFVSDDDLEKEYVLRGLVPADPYSLAAVNEADPAFADTHPNGTHWKNSDGKWCFAAFDRWGGGRGVNVGRGGDDWDDGWWFGGLRK